MRIAVTGASGFIGSAVSGALRAAGHDVVGIGRRAGEGVVRWDPTSHTVDMPALGALDAIVHLAGEPIGGGWTSLRWTSAKRQAILASRVDGTRTVASIVRQLEVPTVVSGSAIGYYGDRGDEILNEESAPGEGFLADVVKAWEHEAQAIADLGARVVMIRTGIVLDKDGGELMPKMLPIFKLGAGGKLGAGDQWVSWISLTDEVRAITAAIMDDGLSGPVNLTAPNPVRNEELTDQLATALSRPSFLSVPAFALKTVLGSGLAQDLLLASQRVHPEVLTERGFEFEHPTLQEALAAIL